VRLVYGDYGRETKYSDDPVAVATRWQQLGAPLIHVVDLDGAKAGQPVNHDLMASICRAVSVPVEVSGGLRTLDAVREAFNYGATRVQLGSAAVRDPELVRTVAAAFPLGMVVSIDARDGEVRTDGWLRGSDMRALDLGNAMAEAGVARVMFTDIGRDGTLGEPNFEALAELVRELPIPVVASGGVARIEHLLKLASIGCEGAIVGKALYEGAFRLDEAIAAVSG
jgi:phosphoribosylformimino-5-aminoimidazole carboxamide ribotide isomerase